MAARSHLVKSLKIRIKRSDAVLLLLFILPVIIIFILTTIEYKREEESLLEIERGIFPQKTLEETINKLERKVSEDPEDIFSLTLLGLAYYQKGANYYSQALNNLYKAWQLGSNDIRIYGCMGVIYDRLNLKDYAVNEYKKYIRNKPNDFYAYFKLGNLYFRNNELDSAMDCYESAYRLAPKNLSVLYNLAVVYQKKNLLDEAEHIWLAAIEAHKKLPPKVYYFLYEIYKAKNDPQRATFYLNKFKESSR
jgi:cytochrome c-type biogenesis protein CcmH/NrfG